jgi:hypothetical protein
MVRLKHVGTWATGAAACAFTLLSAGCACPSVQPYPITPDAAPFAHSIFNPQFNTGLSPIAHGSDWPATFASRPIYDDTGYRITVWDYQGRVDHEHDYQRRVYSVQQGFIQR